MIKRKIQVITSRFGLRWGVPHKGVDLRSWTDNFKTKLPAILPEECEFVRRKYQKKWGWTLIFKPFKTAGYKYLKFTHVENNDEFIPGHIYPAKKNVAHTTRTKYMIKKKWGDHLHFETWKYGKIIDRPIDPEIYFEIRDIPKRRK